MAETKAVTKKVINSPETCVDDNLRGVVATYPGIQLHPKHRVLTLRWNNDTGRVAVLGGGGSGHEPFAAGFVGQGMLDGCVAGGVFASPPTGNVLYGIAQLAKYNSGGVLVIIGNYTGDRLNFGKAIEKAKISGIKVEGLIVGEDVASSKNKTGGRSMVGEVLFYKLCGAMADKGYALDVIRDEAKEANKYMATLGVCLSACSLPGQPPLFEIASDEMELGAGVHGEAGIAKIKMGTAKQVVASIMDQIVSHLQLRAGDEVSVTVNNLGGTSFMEMNIISAEVRDYLELKKITPLRLYSSHLKTSLEMHGFQICLLHHNKNRGSFWLELLDWATDAPSWTSSVLSQAKPGVHVDDDSLLQTHQKMASSGPSLTESEQRVFRAALSAGAGVMVDSEELLNRLDSGCGDGDCGITMKKYGTVISNYLQSASLQHPSRVVLELSELAEREMGGTSGAIYSLGLAASAQALAGADTNSTTTWLNALESAIQSISKYGGAEPGDRTMLDTLSAVYEALKVNLGSDLKVILSKTMEAAEAGAKSTASMVARAGRASYVASGYIHDEDAGARASAIWLQAILNSIATNIELLS